MSDSSDNDAKLVEEAEKLLSAHYRQNSDFNEQLDGEEPLEISSLKPAEPGEAPVVHKIEKSEALFWADRTAYNDELATWSGRRKLETHNKALTLLEADDQAVIFRDLVDAIRRKRVAPFIGAGMSCPSKFPTWPSSLRAILDKVEEVDRSAVEAAIASDDFLEAAELLWQADDTQVKAYIRNRFAKNRIPQGEAKGPIRLLDQFSSGCIITTNYDSLIEQVVANGAMQGYMHGRQPGHNFVARLIKGERCLLKLHGDAESAEGYVFTRSQYDESYGYPIDYTQPLPKALRQIFISHSLLFLGCSLVQDRTLELFEEVHAKGDFETPLHFAILSEPKNGETRLQKENRLLKVNIHPLWFPKSEYEYVEDFLKLAIACSKGELMV